jgi:hypothetical protein
MTDDAAEFRPRARSGIRAADLSDGELGLYDPATNEMLLLNASATAVWACCDGSATVAEIVAEIVEVFGVDPVVVRSQVHGLVGEWSRRKFLESPGPGG